MTVVKEPVDPRSGERAARRTLWSWLMIPALAFVFVLTNLAYLPVLEARGQSEGDLLAMTEDVAGVALEAAFALLLAVPPVLGVILAVRALRLRAGRWARAALAVNAVLVLFVLYQFADAMRMSFFAPLD